MSSESNPEILKKTDQWLVVSKPSGWLTIPGRNAENSRVLSEWALEHHSPIWIVHRLDRETSGVVLFARTSQDHHLANTWFQERKTKKVYHCLASGQARAPLFKIQSPIAGSSSLTQVEVLENYQEAFLARVFPRTGRRHQIRIHLSESGFPIWGDTLYKGPRNVDFKDSQLLISRVALHASVLELPSGEIFKASLPPDFEEWLKQLRMRGHRV